MKWIFCKDQLPDSDTTVMTWVPDSNEPIWPGDINVLFAALAECEVLGYKAKSKHISSRIRKIAKGISC